MIACPMKLKTMGSLIIFGAVVKEINECGGFLLLHSRDYKQIIMLKLRIEGVYELL